MLSKLGFMIAYVKVSASSPNNLRPMTFNLQGHQAAGYRGPLRGKN